MNIVFGGTKYIGSSLCKHFSKKQNLIVGTYYNTPKKNLVYFDVKSQDLDGLNVDLKKARYGFICSAISNIDYCKKNQEEAYKVNVLGNKRLIKQLWSKNIFPIFFSSDAVFNGEKGSYVESDKTDPCNVYGKHKKTIEDFLIRSKKPFLIVRLSKVFGNKRGDETLLTSWVEQLLADEKITCTRDQIFSPIFIGDLINSLELLMEKKLRGVYNLGPPESFNRYDLANMVKKQLKIKTGEIKPVLTKDLNFLDARPLDTTMNCKKFIRDTGYVFRLMEDCINSFLNFR